MRNKILITFLMVVAILPYCKAQQEIPDTISIKLEEFIVSGERLLNFSSGTKTHDIDSTSMQIYAEGTLSDILSNESSMFVKTRGMGALASSSFRGGSANHTALIWNGFSLNNPMNGQNDLSLLPVYFTDKIEIQYGGMGALWGSGAVGGSIHLSNNIPFDKGISVGVSSTFTSFSGYSQSLKAELSKPRWSMGIKAYNAGAENNFPYVNTALDEHPTLRQKNAGFNQKGIMGEIYHLIKENHKINMRFWYQNSLQRIPPTMFQSISVAHQKDDTYRLSAEWQHTHNSLNLLARTGFFNENQIFNDSISHILTHNKIRTLINETEGKLKVFKNHLLNGGISHTYTEGISDFYIQKEKMQKLALMGSYTFASSDNKIHISASARNEWYSTGQKPFTWSLGSSYDVVKYIRVKANISKAYRMPTLNDLYWNPGGNPDLLPESGYNAEAGFEGKGWLIKDKLFLSFEPTIFTRQINNWIIWLPKTNYWSPRNILEVWSRGMETRTKLSFKKKKLMVILKLNTNYVVSTNMKAISKNDLSVDKQLIYVPMYSGKAKAEVRYKSILLAYTQSYTGYRYTSSDNTEYLPPFYLSNAHLSYSLNKNPFNLRFFAEVRNIFNTVYQVIQTDAMPLRHYMVGINVEFNKPNNIKK